MPKKTAVEALTPEQVALTVKEAQGLQVQISSMPVTQANMEIVGAILVDVKKRYKSLKAMLDTFTKPHREAEATVRGWFNPGLNALAAAEAHLKQGIADAQRAQFAQNAEMQQQAQVALQAGDVRGAALAVHNLAPIVSPQGVNVREVLAFRVVEPDRVPRELCSPDDAKIKAAVAAGHREIPGVLVGLESVVSVRTGG